jgi:tocopherol O-methyltransferase
MTATLNQQIRQFYDSSSALWEQVWGEHMHHGYYGADGQEKKERRQAQIDLIEELLIWGLGENLETRHGASLQQQQETNNILDVGCGIGGSSLYLGQKFNASVTGITLSPVQAARVTERAAAAKISDRTKFLVADALAMPFADNSFDYLILHTEVRSKLSITVRK